MLEKLKKFLNRRVEVTMRMVLMLTLAMVVVVMATAFNLEAQQRSAHDRCVETQQRARATAPALRALVAAHQKDGDPAATAVWQKYLAAAQANPIPKC